MIILLMILLVLSTAKGFAVHFVLTFDDDMPNMLDKAKPWGCLIEVKQ